MSLNMFSVIIHEAYLEVRFGLVRVYMLSLFVFWDFFQLFKDANQNQSSLFY